MRRAWGAAAAMLLPCTVFAAPIELPTIEVVAVSPVSGSEIQRDKVPGTVETVEAPELDHAKSPDLLQSMLRTLPGVTLSDQSGNPFQVNLDYRGFTASPVQGTPQGIAVYQNGTRINEAYGDVVNWDFIPEMAINRMTLMSNNPVFGLNAIGGALSIEMKNGFNYQGQQIELRGGSFGRIGASAQAGFQSGNYSAYVAADATNDQGWRDFSSFSRLRRLYADVGARTDQTEFHVSFTGANDHLGSVVATPIELLNQSWSRVWTWPQTTHLQLAFLQTNGAWRPTDTLALNANAYFRDFRQSHVDGNGTDALPCDPTGPLVGQLCVGDGNTPINKNFPTPDTLSPAAFLGEIDRNWTKTNSYGGSIQATSTSNVFSRPNHFVVGVSIDHGRTNFSGNSELGIVQPNLFVTGTGIFIDQPAADIAPVDLLTLNTYVGVYATNTLDITSELSLTVGGRFNLAFIDLRDRTGQDSLLNSDNRYQRFNPVIGATYKISPGLTAYAGYSEANRAPTPLELGCSSPTHPCMIDNFLIADPPLKQVVGHTIEAGLRGRWSGADTKTQLSWSVGVFRTKSTDDILNIASAAIQGFGYFQNAGDTLRQGVEAKVNYKWIRWNTYANYTFIDATYLTALTISSPNSPFADSNGNIVVFPGDHIPGIPAHRFKAGVEYAVTDAWKLGADINVVGSQFLIHDDSNQAPKVPAYWVVNLHTSYQLTKNVEVFGLVQNLFDQRYYSSGTFFDTGGFTSNTPGGTPFLGSFADPRTFVPGTPFALYAGIRGTFNTGP
jgi:iron complex outermembrane receptor protein